jgi:hypothetical protein
MGTRHAERRHPHIVFTEKLHFFGLMNPEDLRHRF